MFSNLTIMNLTESNKNPILISMNENIDDGKCDRKVYKVIANGSNKWQNKKQLQTKRKIRRRSNKFVSQSSRMFIHYRSICHNVRENIGKKSLSKKEQNSRRDHQEILMTSFRQRLYLFSVQTFSFSLLLLLILPFFLSFCYLYFVALPNMLSYWFILFRSNITKKRSLYVGGFTCVSLHLLLLFIST